MARRALVILLPLLAVAAVVVAWQTGRNVDAREPIAPSASQPSTTRSFEVREIEEPRAAEGPSATPRTSGATPPSALTGVVVDRFGEPVTSFELVALPADARRAHALRERSFTSPEGRFEWALGDGAWSLVARAHAGRSLPAVFHLPTDETARFVLEAYASITGTVLGEDGGRLPDATVHLERKWPAGGAYVDDSSETLTDRTGGFRFEGLRPGIVEVRAGAPGHVDQVSSSRLELAAGASRDLELVLKVAGRLVVELDPSIGLRKRRDIEVEAVRFCEIEGLPTTKPRARTDDAGVCVFDRLPAGEYLVVALPVIDRWHGTRFDSGPEPRASAVVEAGATARVVLTTTPPRTVKISGRVLDRGWPLDGASVSCVDGRGQGASVTSWQGSFELVVHGTGPTTFLVDGIALVEDVPDVTVHSVELALPRGIVKGVCQGPDGATLEGCTVELAHDGQRQSWTDATGRFAFGRVRPGNYEIQASTRDGALSSPPLRVSVSEDEPTELVLRLTSR